MLTAYLGHRGSTRTLLYEATEQGLLFGGAATIRDFQRTGDPDTDPKWLDPSFKDPQTHVPLL